MSRLPTPGADEGSWGTVLNDYLVQSHKADGTLKDGIVTSDAIAPGAVSANEIEDGSISEAKLDSATQTKLNASSGITNLTTTSTASTVVVESSTGTDGTITAATGASAGVLTASDKTKLDGIASGAQVNTVNSVAGKTGAVSLTKDDVGLTNVDNTSDANKPVSTATQTALDLKVDTTSLAAVATTGSYGDLSDIPTTFAPSTHAHADYLPLKNGISPLTDSTSDDFARVNISDDGSPTSGWTDRLAFYFNGTRSGYFNEYGELRGRPAKSNTVALRAMKWAGSSSVDIFQVANSDSSVLYYTVGPTLATLSVPLSSTSNISTTGTVNASNIGNKVTSSSTAPSSPSVGDVWVDTST